MPPLLNLALRNGLGNKGRTALTALVIAVAVVSFGVLQTAVRSYYQGAEASAPDRLVTRHKVSLMFELPMAYRDRIREVQGVKAVAHGNWFGGYYQDQKNFFAQFAVDDSYLDLYPEFVLTAEEKKAFLSERKACVIGEKLARRWGWKLGDSIVLTGTIYDGNWEFIVRGIYRGRDRTTDTTAMLFRFDYLNEWVKARYGNDSPVGWYVVQIADPNAAPRIGKTIDAAYADSTAQTLTETEKAFQMSFVSMAGTVVEAIRIISFIVILIVLLVMANTMMMTARERVAQYGVMKTLGFHAPHLVAIIAGEAMVISLAGAALGIALAYPVISVFGAFMESNLGAFFPSFTLQPGTVAAAVGLCAACGVAAAVFPLLTAVRLPIAAALRKVN
ncbi:MAG: ABC transporter permease [Acidobacteria bacterium]|nr:ABC transporter permease [Acidobacteriota bacterium]